MMVSRRRHAPPESFVPAPFDVLTAEERQALWAWRQRWGAIASTREPDEDRTFLLVHPVRVPLIELARRPTYDRLVFSRWRVNREVRP